MNFHAPAAAAIAAALLAAPRASAQETFREIWLADRLTLGVGVGAASLTDNHRRADKESGYTYVGFVNELEDEHATFLSPEITWWAARNLRLHLSYDHVEGHTRNYNNHRSDGTVRLRGPLFEAEFVYPLVADTLFPHVGVGFAWEKAKFKPETWWRLGWTSAEEYEADGRVGKAMNGHFRIIEVDDDIAWVLSAGVSWRPSPRVQLDASIRHVWVEPDCEYGEYTEKRGYEVQQTGNFWLDHLTASVSASYVF